MKIFVTGATGYIGGSIAAKLIEQGDSVRGLARSAESASAIARLGVEPVLASLQDHEVLSREAAKADAVVNAADADDAVAPRVFVEALAGSGKVLIHTSGSTV